MATAAEIARTLGHGREYKNGQGWRTFCPVHEASGPPHTPSLDVEDKPSGPVAVCRTQNCEAMAELRRRGLLPDRAERRRQKRALGRELAFYGYQDESGAELFQVVRFEPKDFRQRHRGPDGQWVWNLNGVRRVLYRLPQIIESAKPRPDGKPAKGVLNCEGERDADNLAALGFIATTNPGGAGKWLPSYNESLRGRRVAILPDNDRPGQLHAETVARNLVDVASEVKIVPLPGLPPKGDVSDWLAAQEHIGKTPEQIRAALLALIEAAPIFTAETAAAVASRAIERKQSRADVLIALALSCVETFHDGETAFGILKLPSHREVLQLQSKSFRDLLFKLYIEQEQKAPDAENVRAAINTLCGFARFGSDGRQAPQHKVAVRLAEAGGKIYLDLADEYRRAVEIDANGWRLIDDPTGRGAYFRRPDYCRCRCRNPAERSMTYDELSTSRMTATLFCSLVVYLAHICRAAPTLF